MCALSLSLDQTWVRTNRVSVFLTTSEPDELPLVEGQHVRVLQVQDDGWWLGYAADAPERMGLFPSNYVCQVVEQRPQQVRQPTNARVDTGEDDDDEVEARESVPRQRTRALERDVKGRDDSNEDEDDDDDDYERQQHERRTRQRIQQHRRHPHNVRDRRDVGDDDDGAEEDDDDVAAVAPVQQQQQQRKVSVLQLKRSLADAERTSDAARAARLQVRSY